MEYKVPSESVDITKQNIQKIKELFPEVLTDGEKIDFDLLRTVLGEVVEDNNERYSFNWHGKKAAILGAQKPSKGTLRPVKEKSKNFDTTENLYIEGDNLEVLKLLQKSYNNKIKMIYIDPPYNTGKDFVYKDNFRDGVNNYLEQTGQVDSEGNKVSTNTERNGRFHTDWLNMMYPRLKLARNLLKDDGVIFISIDDNEETNLSRICDEVFGENNFVAKIPWQARMSIQNDTDLSSSHEYILVYAKKRRQEHRRLKESNMKVWHSLNSFACLPLPLDPENFSNLDNDPRGDWKADPFDAPNVRPNLTYSITNPNTGDIYWPPQGRCWRTEEHKFYELLEDGRIIFGRNGTSRPQLKVFYNEKKDFGSVANTWFEGNKYGTATRGTKEIQKLFDNLSLFDTPKPTDLIKNLITLAVPKNEECYILDFFAGSSTTADAIMQLNAVDKGKRKFILVQIPEKIDESKAAFNEGYNTISDLGLERIRRAGEKVKADLIAENNKAGILDENAVDPESLDIGFKVLDLDKSNIREWNVDFENIGENLDLFEDVFVEGRSELDIVYEIMLKNGLELTYPVNSFQVDGKNIYDIAYGNLFICLDNKINTNVAKAIIEKRDEYGIETSTVVFKDAGFNGNDSEKLNCIELLKDAGYPEDNLLTI